MQYPWLNLSLNAARDTGAVLTNGLTVSFDMLLWNRISLRTSLWSRDLQERWHNCAIAAAFSGFN
jgi:hypothetical protein